MASQPANSTIQVFQRIRSERQMLRHNNIKAMCNRMRPLVMVTPGQETQILSTFDADTNIVTTALTSNRRGLPVVRYLRPVVPFATAIENIAGVNFPVTIGADSTIESTSANVRNDIMGSLRTLNTPNSYR